MIILEKGKNNIRDIWRLDRFDSGSFNRTEIGSAFINSFDSIDCELVPEIRIVVNSDCHYKINVNFGKTQDFISSIIKPEIRDQKINTILS
jgi:hypothetical protein